MNATNTIERIELEDGFFIDLTTFPTYYEAYLGHEERPVRIQLAETDKDQFDKDFFTKIALVRSDERRDTLIKLCEFYAENLAPITGEIVLDTREQK